MYIPGPGVMTRLGKLGGSVEAVKCAKEGIGFSGCVPVTCVSLKFDFFF